MADSKQCLVVECSCGGWVIAAVLPASKDTWREVTREVALGYTLRTPVTVEYVRASPTCKYRGRCISDPDSVKAEIEAARVSQVEVFDHA